jgi:hypothetical protein
LVRHRRKPAELLNFGHFFDDAPVTHFYAQPIESVEMTHEGSKVRTCVRIRAHGKSFRASLRHPSIINHLYPKSASSVRHQPRAMPMVTGADLHTLSCRPCGGHAQVRTLFAVETEEPLTEIYAAIAVIDAFLAEPKAGAPCTVVRTDGCLRPPACGQRPIFN